MEINWIEPALIEDMLTPDLYRTKFIDNLNKVLDSGFEVKPLSSFVDDIYRGNTPEHKENGELKEGLLLKTVNVKRNELDLSKYFTITNNVFNENKRFQVKSTDALITIMGATDEVLGRCWSCNLRDNILFSDGLAILKNIKNIDKEYLTTFLNSDIGHNLLLQWSSGSTRKYITNERLSKINIPVPSRSIQSYIGNKVRKGEEYHNKALQLRNEAESIFESQINIRDFEFDESLSWRVEGEFLEPYLNVQFYNKKYLEFQKYLKTIGIKVVPLKSVVRRIIKNSSPKDTERNEDGIPSLIVSDIDPYNVAIKNSKIKVKDCYYERLKEDELLDNDVVFTTAGPPLGEASLITKNMLPLLSGAHVATLRPNEKVTAGYLTVILNSIIGQLEVQKHSYGIRQQYIFSDQLTQFLIPLLDMKLQQEIHEKIYKSMEIELISKSLINEAKEDVEALIVGDFDETQLKKPE